MQANAGKALECRQNAGKLNTILYYNIERRDMAELIKKYTGRFQVLWDNYFWAKEQIERRKNTISSESTQEKIIMCDLNFVL